MKTPSQYTSIGGQAVLEGVMMRSPHFISVAVRKSDSKIVLKSQPFQSIAAKFPVLKKPILRGVVLLLESMVHGIQSLSFSANIAAEEEEKKATGKTSNDAQPLTQVAIALSIISAIAMGMGLFVALPHLLTALIAGENFTVHSPLFHLIDGLIKMTILTLYVYLIALMKDIHRVFQYHGAEHKSIYAFEAGLDLTVENARKFSTQHPRCGTSFLLFLVLISVLVFSVVFPVFGLTKLSETPIINHLLMIVVKIGLMMPVAGLSYEFIKLAAKHMDNPFFRALVWPGMVLQNLTTREPDDSQLEVALASLRQVLSLEKKALAPGEEIETFEIAVLSEIALVPSGVSEFPEG